MDPYENAFADWKDVVAELTNESERACAIVGAAFLDELLGQVLEKYLLANAEVRGALFDTGNPNAILTSFGSRIAMATAVGLISTNDMKVLKKLKDIRNK